MLDLIVFYKIISDPIAFVVHRYDIVWPFLLFLPLLMAVVHDGEWMKRVKETPHDLAISDSKAARPLRALIIGAGDVGKSLARSLREGDRYVVVGFIDDEIEGPLIDDEWDLLGERKETMNVVSQHAIDEIFIAYAPTWQQQLVDDLSLRCPDVQLHVVPSPFEALLRTSKVRSYRDIALVRLSFGAGIIEKTVKRSFDIVVTLMALVLLSPLILIVAMLIKFTSEGPVIFKQVRVGRNGKPFTIYKYRTMVVDAESRTGPILSEGANDSRLHPIGYWLKLFRIDEIPQLWNVLLGEMSLVGPRPERPYFVEKYVNVSPAYSKRHLVRPGITGLAQIHGGYHTDARDKLRFDLIYVSHYSLTLDFSILLRTALVVIFPHRKRSKDKL